MLHEILTHKRRELASIDRRAAIERMSEQMRGLAPARSLRESLTASTSVALIAEIKRKSPSKGILGHNVDPVSLAAQYESGGASAISVLTDSRYFDGSIDDLASVKSRTRLPVLRKDFIVEEYQIFDSRVIGADAILLIVAALPPKELARLHRVTGEVGLEALVEVHDECEVEIAIDCGAEIIGINNRNLKTFEVSLSTTERLRRLIPKEIVCVSESGIACHDDMKRLAGMNVDAALVGERLMTASDLRAAIQELLGVKCDKD